MRSKLIPLLSLLSLLLLLSGCGVGGVKEAGSAARSLDAKRNFIPYIAFACSTEDTVYYAVNDLERGAYFLYYMDKKTGITGPLCGKPECRHTGGSCNAHLGSSPNGLSVYDGKLYWLENEYVPTGGAYGYSVICMELDGTDRREIRKVTNEFLALEKSQMNSFSASFHRGYLYLSYQPAYIVDGEQTWRNYICAFPLDTDEDEIRILDEDYHFIYKLQFYGDSIYILTGDDTHDILLRRLDIKSGQMETLFDGELPFLGTTYFWVNDSEMLMLGCIHLGTDENGNNQEQDNVYRLDLASGEFEKAYTMSEPPGTADSILPFASDNLFVEAIMDESGTRVLAKDFEGNTVLDTFVDADILSSSDHSIIAGADEANIYVLINSFPNSFIAIPLDGSEARIVLTCEK